jgi:hypothetical protein
MKNKTRERKKSFATWQCCVEQGAHTLAKKTLEQKKILNQQTKERLVALESNKALFLSWCRSVIIFRRRRVLIVDFCLPSQLLWKI